MSNPIINSNDNEDNNTNNIINHSNGNNLPGTVALWEVGRVPLHLHVLIPRICDCYFTLLCGKRHFANVVKMGR